MRLMFGILSVVMSGPLFSTPFSILDNPRILQENRKETISPKLTGPINRLTFKIERAKEDAIVKVSQDNIKLVSFDIPKSEPLGSPGISEFSVKPRATTGVSTSFRIELVDGEQAVLKDVLVEFIPEIETFFNSEKPLAAAFRNCLNQSIITASGKCTIGNLNRDVYVSQGPKMGSAVSLQCGGEPAELLYKHFSKKEVMDVFTYDGNSSNRVTFGKMTDPIPSQCVQNQKTQQYFCTFAIDVPCDKLSDLTP